MRFDCIFVHVPKSNKDGQRASIMPMGLIALADFLTRNGIGTQVLNVDAELSEDPDFDLIEYVRGRTGIVCMDLHWHHQSYDVIDTARRMKHGIADIKIILGGMTAGFFAEEIIKDFPFVDFIIKGDSEEPLLMLCKVLTGKSEMAIGSLRNLVYQKNGVRSNPHTYVTPAGTLDDMRFSNFSLMKNAEACLHISLESQEGKKEANKTFYYNIGRGCPVSCSFCGGSNTSQRIIRNCGKVIFKSTESAILDLNGMLGYGIGKWYTSFDPLPGTGAYQDLFRRIRKEGIGINCVFECWRLPTRGFIEDFKRTFGTESMIIISPETGSERVRRINKGYFYGNDELEETLDHITKMGVKCMLSFSAGLPFETREDVDATISYILRLRRIYPSLGMTASTIEMEPASPWFIRPDRYCITTNRKSFMDFYNASKGSPGLGYRTKEFTEEEILSNLKMIKSVMDS